MPKRHVFPPMVLRPQGKFKKQRAQQEGNSAGSQGRIASVEVTYFDRGFIETQITCESKYVDPHINMDLNMEVQYDLVLGDAILVLRIGMRWLLTFNFREPREQPTMRFLDICHQTTSFFHMEDILYIPTSFISAVFVR